MSSTEPPPEQPGQSGSSDNGVPTVAPEVTASSTDQTSESPMEQASADNNSGDLIDLGEDSSKMESTEEQSSSGAAEQRQELPAVEKPSHDPTDLMASSIATLKPSTAATTTATQYLTIEASTYVDPTPKTPLGSQTPSRTSSSSGPRTKHTAASADPSPTRSEPAYDEKPDSSEDDQESSSRSEIQTIMEQFSEEGGGPGAEEVMSPRLGMASPMLASPVQHPPRKSSLEPLAPSIAQQLQDMHVSTPSSGSIRSTAKEQDDDAPPVPPKDAAPSIRTVRSQDELQGVTDSPLSPTMSLHRPPPPEPEPEPALQFDFHRFLKQLQNKKADPVAKYLRSFLMEFGKRQWMVHEQVKIVSDFLAFISSKMAQCEIWRDVSDAEFDNAREGMEKLVMNRLYALTFSPAIPPPQPVPGAKGKKRSERTMGPGRRGQHQEDVERDEILAQKIQIYSWVKEEHLDIPPVSESGKRFLKLAQDELLKIKSYRAPRDKVVCVLNCCKVIFGLLKHSKSDSSADSFMPMLIYVVLHANPEHLVSNVQYVLRFRNQDKLGGEAGYYLSSLMGAIQFIENMDRTTLTITDEEFEANVEAAVSAIAEKHKLESPPMSPVQSEKPSSTLLQPPGITGSSSSSTRPSLDSDAALRPSPSTPRRSLSSNAPRKSTSSTDPRRSTSSNEAARDSSGEYSGSEETAAISGLLRTIQKPLSSIGRIFSDEGGLLSGGGESSSSSSTQPSNLLPGGGPARTPQPVEAGSAGDGSNLPSSSGRQKLSAEEAAARQASAEVAEAQRLHRAEHANIVETLAGMFPDLDREIISDVVYQKEGRVGLAVDACLALSA